MSLFRGLATRFSTNASKGTTDHTKHDAHIYQQQTYRAGLFVTQELDRAILRCKTKVEHIARECRSKNRRFRDIEFDLANDQERCLHGLATPEEDKYNPADVLRVSQIFDDPQFFIDGTEFGDIEQGRLGDCWFLCALATLSTVPGLIEKMCVARDEKVGIYGFIFLRDGEWEDVIIDDQLYSSVPKYETLPAETKRIYHENKDMYNKVARKGRKTLYFACSNQENETWVPLIEKAFAKFHGDYASLSGGHACQALEDLTGGVSQVIYTNDIFDKDEFWNKELMLSAKDRLFGCYLDSLAGKGTATDYTTTNGLYGSHAYSILNAVEYKGKRFIKVRNPWGKSEWNGRWSDGSKEWTEEWLGALKLLNHTFGDDGAFIMVYEDFLDTWYAVERTQLFDSSWIQSSHWLNVVSRTFPCAWQFGDVSFTFSLPKASPATIVLAQSDTRFYSDISGYAAWSFDFVLYKKGSEHVMGRSEFSLQRPRSVILDKELEAGEYVLHVRLDKTHIRDKDYLAQGVFRWDTRKLSRVLGERARSMSITANFDSRAYSSYLVVPPETFAGRDLLQMEMESFEAASKERKELKRKFFPKPAQVSVSIPNVASTNNGEDPEHTESVVQVPEGVEAPDGVEAPEGIGAPEGTEAPEGVEVEGPEAEADDPNHSSETNDPGSGAPHNSTVLKVHTETTTAEAHNGPDPSSPAGPIHAVACDTCGQVGFSGVRWKCLVCDDYDLCDDCHGSGFQSLQHSVRHWMHRMETPDEPPVQHLFCICDGCEMNPLVGIRWSCLMCDNYELCDACHSSGAHPADHQMLKIESPADGEDVQDTYTEGDDNTLVLGLRVYTKDNAPVTISGQLRHGALVSWKKSS